MQKFARIRRFGGETSARLLALMLISSCLLGTVRIRPLQANDALDVRLRIAWGGGESRLWRGAVTISDGVLSDVRGLALEPDSPGSLFIDGRSVRIAPRSATNYAGMDVSIAAPREATLTFDLTPIDRPTESKQLTVPLTQLLTDFHNSELDGRGNRLIVRRAPGDQLRIELARDSLVFATSEALSFTVRPNETGLAAASAIRAVVQLVEARTTNEFWSHEQEFVVADDGSLPTIAPEAIVLPKKEGAYDLLVSLYQRKLTDKFLRAKPLLQRKLQLVVVDERPQAADVAEWRSVGDIDPTSEHWWDRLTRLPGFTRLPGYLPDPLGNDAVARQVSAGLTWMRLDRGGWRAYPLPISGKGKPHILEIEFPADVTHTLGISILEPNAAGQVTPIGLDSGVEVMPSLAPASTRIGLHRVVFWPRTDSPFLLLTNRGAKGPAMFGKIRVLAGPRSLAGASPIAPLSDERMFAAFFAKPLFNENFTAEEALDEWTGRSLDDWQTFLDGARRFVEYLKYAGYNAAVVTVACEGSTIYPSQLLAPTAKYDNGLFFYTGQDPFRKDVLELLFRLFDREGLKLIPAVQFATPLPALEELRRRGPLDADGLDLVGADGRTWLMSRGTRRGLAPYYNLLDARVQHAMRDVLKEVTLRYDRHRSFEGVALDLGTETFAQLPGEAWGYDNRTMRRYAAESTADLPDSLSSSFPARVEYLQREGRDDWLAWRARVVGDFYRDAQKDIAARRRSARLYLNMSDLFAAAELRHELRPTLPSRPVAATSLLPYGLDLAELRANPAIVVPRPNRAAPLAAESTRLLNAALNEYEDLTRVFGGEHSAGSWFFRESAAMRVEDFDAASPFGATSTHTWLLAHIPPALEQNRRRFVQSLAENDQPMMIDGGWMLALGQEDSTRELARTFRLLPNQPFETIRPSAPDVARQPLVVRRLARADRTYFYVVNNFPWPTKAEFDLSAPAGCVVTPLGSRRISPLTSNNGGARWSLELAPYDFVAVQFNSPDVVVRDWRVVQNPAVVQRLQQEVQQLSARANLLMSPPPYEGVANAGFEDGVDRQIPGWVAASGKGIVVERDAVEPRGGKWSLHVKSDGPVVWVRSEPFAPPRTGRAFVMVWLRVKEVEQQPPLRLAIEARSEDGPYYRWSNVGAGTGFKVDDQWGTAPYLAPLELPAEGISELRIGFDLMGAGELWIDDVQLHHLYFHEFDPSKPSERTELRKQIAAALFQLEANRIGDCHAFLDSYWPRFLAENLPAAAPRLAENEKSPSIPMAAPPPLARAPSEVADKPDESEPAEETSRWQKLRDYLPKRLLPF